MVVRGLTMVKRRERTDKQTRLLARNDQIDLIQRTFIEPINFSFTRIVPKMDESNSEFPFVIILQREYITVGNDCANALGPARLPDSREGENGLNHSFGSYFRAITKSPNARQTRTPPTPRATQPTTYQSVSLVSGVAL